MIPLARSGPFHSSDSQGDLTRAALGTSGAPTEPFRAVLTPLPHNFGSQLLSNWMPGPSKVMFCCRGVLKSQKRTFLALVARKVTLRLPKWYENHSHVSLLDVKICLHGLSGLPLRLQPVVVGPNFKALLRTYLICVRRRVFGVLLVS